MRNRSDGNVLLNYDYTTLEGYRYMLNSINRALRSHRWVTNLRFAYTLEELLYDEKPPKP